MPEEKMLTCYYLGGDYLDPLRAYTALSMGSKELYCCYEDSEVEVNLWKKPLHIYTVLRSIYSNKVLCGESSFLFEEKTYLSDPFATFSDRVILANIETLQKTLKDFTLELIAPFIPRSTYAKGAVVLLQDRVIFVNVLAFEDAAFDELPLADGFYRLPISFALDKMKADPKLILLHENEVDVLPLVKSVQP